MENLSTKLYNFLSAYGIEKVDDENRNLSHQVTFHNTSSLESGDGNEYRQDNLSPCVTVTGHEENGIIPMAACYVHRRITYNKTPLHLCAEFGNTMLVGLFLKSGAEVDAKDNFDRTPLHLCTRNGHKRITEMLIEAKAAVDAEDKDRRTPLHLCAENGHADIVLVLVAARATVDAIDSFQQTPLHVSVRYGHKEIVGILLEATATVNVRDCNKQTPLNLCVRYGHNEIFEILKNAGAAKNDSHKFSIYLSSMGKLVWILTWIYPLLTSVVSVWKYAFTTKEVADTVSSSDEITESNSDIISTEETISSNGQDHISQDIPTHVISEREMISPDVISQSDSPAPKTETRDILHHSKEEFSKAILQLLEKHLGTLFMKHNQEGGVFHTALGNGITIVIPITIQRQKVMKINNAGVVSTNSRVVVRPATDAHADDYNDAVDDSSSSQKDSE